MRPNTKYPHAYAIVRLDKPSTPPAGRSDLEDLVTVTRVLPTEEEAIREVARLNGLAEARGTDAHYFWQVTRLTGDPLPSSSRGIQP
jgi:hypothetical protein